jgi:hypothetical protein
LKHLDDVFFTINGKRQYLWRAVEQDGEVPDILVIIHTDLSNSISFPAHLVFHVHWDICVKICTLNFLESKPANAGAALCLRLIMLHLGIMVAAFGIMFRDRAESCTCDHELL